MPKTFFVFFLFISYFTVLDLNGQSLKLVIEGETKSATTTLDSIGYKTTFTNYRSIKNELNTLVDRYQKLGYIESTLESIKKNNDSTYLVNIRLGRHINHITIKVLPEINPLIKKLNLKEVSANTYEVKISEVERLLNRLNIILTESGDPFTSVQLINITVNNNQLIADLVVRSNQLRYIDKVIIKGYEAFPKSFIKRFLKIKTGDLFDINKIKRKTRQLNDLSFANQIKEPEVLFSKDSTLLYLYLEKSKANNFDGFLGFGTNETTNKFDLDGYLNLQLINNLNYGESLRLLYKSDEIDQQTFNLSAELPYMFSSPIGLDVGLNIFKKDSTFITVNQTAKLTYQINSKQRLAAGIQYVSSSDLNNTNTLDVNDYNSNFYLLNYTYRQTQLYDRLFPVNFLLDINASFGKRSSNNINVSQSSFNLHTFKIFNLNNRNSIFTRLTAAQLNSENYLDNELFRFGGINSVRGFEENSLVANLYGVINTEYRYRLGNNLYVHSVLDASYAENELLNNTSKLFGFGFGFGLLTNAGLFKFTYASGKTQDRQFKLSDSKIHISLTATF
ncbi:MAG: hypothetical protein HKP28_05700 [Winogradskyella sp.]|nr:hypothetical protein [Winogradskyella sp.]